MANRKSSKSVESFYHDEASRRHIPTAEMEPLLLVSELAMLWWWWMKALIFLMQPIKSISEKFLTMPLPARLKTRLFSRRPYLTRWSIC